MFDFQKLRLLDCGIAEKIYNPDGTLKGYVAEISFETFIECDYDWIWELSNHLAHMAGVITEDSEVNEAEKTHKKNNK